MFLHSYELEESFLRSTRTQSCIGHVGTSKTVNSYRAFGETSSSSYKCVNVPLLAGVLVSSRRGESHTLLQQVYGECFLFCLFFCFLFF